MIRTTKTIAAALLLSGISASMALAGTPYTPSKVVNAPVQEETGGWYFGLFGGATWQGDQEEASFGYGPLSVDISEDSEVGGHAGLELGYIIPSTSRVKFGVEIEGMWNGYSREADIDVKGNLYGIHFNDSFSAEGDVNSFSGLFNGVIRVEAADWLNLYAGAGAGYYFADVDNLELEIYGQNVEVEASTDEDGFAWQAFGGVEVPIDNKWAIFAEYHYLKFEDSDVTSSEQHLLSGGVRIFW